MVVGPKPAAAGGIAVVIGTLLTSSLAERFQLLPVATHRDGGRATKFLQAIAGISSAAWLLAARRVDLVYLQTSSGASLRRKAIVARLARVARRPYVLHVHGSDFDNYYRDAPSWERRLVRTTLSRAALVIALSPEWERRLREIVSARMIAIPNPVPIPDEPAPLDSDELRIVSLGRLGERKGSQVLVRALALLADRRPEARLVLAGDGDPESVRGLAQSLGVDAHIELPGWVGSDERDRILRNATVFALPSREEGLPVALLEAMAYGLPSVVTAVGGVPDVFEDGRHGYYVPVDDPAALAEQLLRVFSDPEGARRMGEQAREDAQRLCATPVVASRVGDALESALRLR